MKKLYRVYSEFYIEIKDTGNELFNDICAEEIAENKITKSNPFNEWHVDEILEDENPDDLRKGLTADGKGIYPMAVRETGDANEKED